VEPEAVREGGFFVMAFSDRALVQKRIPDLRALVAGNRRKLTNIDESGRFFGSFGFQEGWRHQAAGSRIRLGSRGSQGGFAIRPAYYPLKSS